MADREMGAEECCRAFAESYEVSGLEAMRRIERSVLGCDYGGTSWTTRGQAEEIVGRLGLRRGVRLLELGAGAGWPGLFLAESAGCEVVLVDMPLNALVAARRRARADGLEDRVEVVGASGVGLPFARASFQAVSHSDVLCCLADKLAVLRECRRLVSAGSPMLFSVLAVVPGLGPEKHRRAVEVGPPFVEGDMDYAEMLDRAGWRLVERLDLSADFRASLRALVAGLTESEELADELGGDVVAEVRLRRRRQIEAIDDGSLVREAFFARAG